MVSKYRCSNWRGDPTGQELYPLDYSCGLINVQSVLLFTRQSCFGIIGKRLPLDTLGDSDNIGRKSVVNSLELPEPTQAQQDLVSMFISPHNH